MELILSTFITNLSVAISSIILGTNVITAAVHGAFHMENKILLKTVSWIIAVLVGLGFVACGGINFGFPVWGNYLAGAILGVIGGGAANGLYEWKAIENVCDVITNVFSNMMPKKETSEEK